MSYSKKTVAELRMLAMEKGIVNAADMKKKDLQAAAGISWASVTKLSKNETVSMDVLMKICKALECNIGDIVDLIPMEEENNP